MITSARTANLRSPFLRTQGLVLALLLLALAVSAPALARDPFPAAEVQAFYSYDASQPLFPQLTLEADFPTYQRYLLTYQSDGQTVYAAYFKPKRAAKGPGLIGVHGIWSDRRDQFWVVAEAAAKNGYAVLLPSLPYHHMRRAPFSLVSGQQFITKDIQRTRDNFRRSVVDMRRGLDWLTAQPEVDADRIGIAGVSLGGVIAAAVLKVEPRIKVGVLAVTAGNLSENLLYSDIEVVKLLRFWLGMGMLDYAKAIDAWAIADPLLLPGAEEKPVLMLNATNDEIFTTSTVQALYRTFRRADILWSTSKHRYPERPAQIQMVEYVNRQFNWHPPLKSEHYTIVESLPGYPAPGDATLSYTADLIDSAGGHTPVGIEVAMVDREKEPVVILDESLDPEYKIILKRSGISQLYIADAESESARAAAAEYLAETSFADPNRLLYARRSVDRNAWEVLSLTPQGGFASASESTDRPAKPLRVTDLFVYLRGRKDSAPASVVFVKATPVLPAAAAEAPAD